MPLTKKDVDKLGAKRLGLMQSLDKGLAKFINQLANRVYSLFLEVLNEMDADEDGNLTNTGKNRNLRTIENNKRKGTDNNKDVGEHVSDGFDKIQKESEEYFGADGDNSRLKSKRQIVFEDLLKKYGVSDKNGVLKETLDDAEIYRKTRLIMLRGVLTEQPKARIQEDIKKFLITDKNFEKHYQRAIQDMFAQFDRALHYKKAVEMGYNAAIFQGGLIDTSRDFCEERNDKVFTIQEIMKFGTKEDEFGGYTDKEEGQFDGKNLNYDPIIDQGGYQCRHFYSFISDSLAIVLRPELKEVLL